MVIVLSCVSALLIVASLSVHGRKSRPIVADVITADQLHLSRGSLDTVEWQSFDCFKYRG